LFILNTLLLLLIHFIAYTLSTLLMKLHVIYCSDFEKFLDGNSSDNKRKQKKRKVKYLKDDPRRFFDEEAGEVDSS